MSDTDPLASPDRALIDISVNLTHESFGDDWRVVVDRARDAGVCQCLITGTTIDESHKALELAHHLPGVLFATAGVHPHDARHWRGDKSGHAIADLAAQGPVVALGEMGLDFNRDYSPRSDQERAFEGQLELAAALGLPVFLHERDAASRFVALVERYRHRLPRGGVVHCFTGDAETLEAYRQLDLHIGITGWICDERRGLHLRDLVTTWPVERLMLETDAPYLLPRTLKPKPKTRRNEPAFLPEVLQVVSRARGDDPQHLATATTATARQLFAMPPPP
ncbi:MAG: TatD family hydrolase [Candidatus Competibacterales bacterium]